MNNEFSLEEVSPVIVVFVLVPTHSTVRQLTTLLTIRLINVHICSFNRISDNYPFHHPTDYYPFNFLTGYNIIVVFLLKYIIL